MKRPENRIYKITSLAVIVGILSFIIGAGLGFLYATAEQIPEEQLVQSFELTEPQEDLSSKKRQDLTLAEDILPEPIKYPRELSDEDFATVCGMVMGEGNGREMYIAIAQCIRNAMELNGWSVQETIDKLYGTPRTEWSELVEECVRGVFYTDWSVTSEPIMFYYAEDLVYSAWHESRPFVLQIKNTRFFK